MLPKVTEKFQILMDYLVCKHTIFPQKLPKITIISGNAKVGKRHPLSKKGIKNAFRMDSSALAAGFLTPHFKNNHLPGKFTNAKYQQTARLNKPSAPAQNYVVNYDYNHYSMCPGSST